MMVGDELHSQLHDCDLNALLAPGEASD